MELIQHSVSWCKGEIYEDKMRLVFGVLIFIIALALWKFGTTPYAKALVLPAGVMAPMLLGIGYYLIATNHMRVDEYQRNRKVFVMNEKQRTDEFIAWYPKTRMIIIGVMFIAMLLVSFIDAPVWKSIGFALMFLAFSKFVIDHFSEGRALKYSHEIDLALEKL